LLCSDMLNLSYLTRTGPGGLCPFKYMKDPVRAPGSC
jgi:hypothetical protein